MILKTIKKENFETEESTESNLALITQYYDNIDYIDKFLSLEHRDGMAEYIKISFRNGNEISLILRNLENDTWIDSYQNVFLMNDDGKTIEKIV